MAGVLKSKANVMSWGRDDAGRRTHSDSSDQDHPCSAPATLPWSDASRRRVPLTSSPLCFQSEPQPFFGLGLFEHQGDKAFQRHLPPHHVLD